MDAPVEGILVEVPGGVLEVYDAVGKRGAPVVCAAHPIEGYVPSTADLLRRRCGGRVVCINPRGVGGSSPRQTESLENMVADIDHVRQRLGIERWVFWGSSGGGWLAQIAARDFPEAVRGVILESVCACYAERVRDPMCVLCPLYVAWRGQLLARGIALAEPHSADGRDGSEQGGQWSVVPGVGRVLLDGAGCARLVLPGESPDSETIRRAHAEFLKFDSRPWLSALSVPALVVAGFDDLLAPFAHSHALHRALPQSTFVLVEGAGHNPGVHGEPTAVQAIRDFVWGFSGTPTAPEA